MEIFMSIIGVLFFWLMASAFLVACLEKGTEEEGSYTTSSTTLSRAVMLGALLTCLGIFVL